VHLRLDVGYHYTNPFTNAGPSTVPEMLRTEPSICESGAYVHVQVRLCNILRLSTVWQSLTFPIWKSGLIASLLLDKMGKKGAGHGNTAFL